MPSTNLLEPETPRPGFGRALNYVPTQSDNDYVGEIYPNALTGDDGIMRRMSMSTDMKDPMAVLRDPLSDQGHPCLLPLTLREIAMMQFMNVITDKVDWHKKIFDKTISDKWVTEAMADGTFTERMTTWCIEELKYKAGDFERTGFTSVYYGVLKSDILIPGDLQKALQAAVKPLEDIPEQQKDWHPGSNEQVLDLVHPSLCPLVYGLSRVLKHGSTSLDDCIERCGQGEVLIPAKNEYSGYSNEFQWLPCEVDISGERARSTTYINNLHPQRHRDLYEAIDQVITHVLPMWSATLWPLRQNLKRRINYTECKYDPDPSEFPGDKSESHYYERRDRWKEENCRVVLPEPGKFEPPQDCAIPSLQSAFKSLQIIVKLANIELTPDKPEYAGGTWHVEGQLNEHICATALYYYSCDNITTSKLAFRQQNNPDTFNFPFILYKQEHHDWLKPVFGLEQGGSTRQVVASINTMEGRVITFPNILQHQVQPFQLRDPSKPGHRKILALFLVDPNIKVLSTANVPCQQKSWWRDAIVEPSSLGKANHISVLPLELQDEIFKGVKDFPMSLEEAKTIRLDLMEERSVFALRSDYDDSWEDAYVISLCEH